MTYLPQLNSSFVIRNITNKDIRIFGTYTLKSGREADLFKVVPNLTESRLLEDLTSGDLDLEINKKGSLVVESHNLTSLRALMNQGREDYLDPDGPVTIYVKTTGNDVDGDGSAARPYRQLRRALRDIPVGTKSDAGFWIQMGAGEFDLCSLPILSSNVFVGIRGDISDPVAEWAHTGYAKTDGYFGRIDVETPGYDAEVGNGTHWLSRYVNDAIPSVGYVVLGSTSPNLVVQNGFMGGTLSLHEYKTIFNVPHAGFQLHGNQAHDNGFQSGYAFHGVQINSPTIDVRFIDVSLKGCKVTNSITLIGGAYSCYFEEFVTFIQNANKKFTTSYDISGSFFTKNLQIDGAVSVRDTTFHSNITFLSQTVISKITLWANDFVVDSSACFISTRPVEIRLILSNMSVNPERVRLWSGPISFSMSNNSKFVGSTTGIPFTLTDGAQAIAIKAACNGTLTNSTNAGQDIVVGGNAVVAFAALPTTDVGAASPQFCRAT